MNYHLNQPGQEPGLVSLEELRRRRQAGELTGTEFVWRQGMNDWQSLDEVLRANPSSPSGPMPPPLPTPPPAQAPAKAKAKRKIGFLVAIVALGLVTLVGGVAAFGFLAAQRQQRLQAAYKARRSRQEIAAKSPWAGRPMVGATNGLGARELQGQAREFRVRQWVEGYETRGDRGTSCDTPSLRMLKQWIVQYYGGSTNAKPVSVTAMCDRLAANPECLDPLVLTVTGVESSEESAKIERLERALAAFPQSKHRGYPKLYAAVSLAATEEYGSPKMHTLDASALGFLGESFSDGSFLPEDQPVLGEIFLTGWGYNFFYRRAPAVTRLAQSPGEPFRWLALMLEGEHHVMLAWRARGGGYADKVTEDGWKGFQTNLVTARQCFSNAWQMHPDWPLAAARMVDVAMGDADAPEMLRWFNRAIAVQVDQPQAWNSLRWGLRPRWHGSLEAMLALGQAAVDTGRFDTDVPRKYFDVVSDLEAELDVGRGHHIYGRPDIWPHFQRMYEGYVAEPTEAANIAGWRSTYAMIAYLAGKYDVARQQLESVQWQPRKGVSEGWGTDGSLFLLEVAARTGPAGATIAAAESNRLRGNLPEAVRLLKEFPGGTNVDERTRSFVNYRLAALDGEMRLRGGGWTDFLPGEDIERGWIEVGMGD